MKRNSFATHTNEIRAFKIKSKKCTIALVTNDRQFHKTWDNCSILPCLSSSSSSSSLQLLLLLPLCYVIAANTFFIIFPTIEFCGQLTGQLFAGTHTNTPDSDHQMLLLNFYLFHKISIRTHTALKCSFARSHDKNQLFYYYYFYNLSFVLVSWEIGC